MGWNVGSVNFRQITIYLHLLVVEATQHLVRNCLLQALTGVSTEILVTLTDKCSKWQNTGSASRLLVDRCNHIFFLDFLYTQSQTQVICADWVYTICTLPVQEMTLATIAFFGAVSMFLGASKTRNDVPSATSLHDFYPGKNANAYQNHSHHQFVAEQRVLFVPSWAGDILICRDLIPLRAEEQQAN